LHRAMLRDARLAGADLRGAELFGARLVDVDLTGADLSGADLTSAWLVGVELGDAQLEGAILHETAFSDCRNLHAARGLEGVVHRGPSTLDVRTLRAGGRRLPDAFLLGTGITAAEMAALRDLWD
ncbi:MAG TPA: pentapeptide repeat-containing protein, partial [Armatimonadota bacterium]|nr:pentapeptide repeat-containing protein [Armatimonadota bacterium]